MQYIEIRLSITPSTPWKDIFTALMADLGCDSFMDGENESDLLCYIPQENFDETQLKTLIDEHLASGVSVQYRTRLMPDKDWNAEWEAHYEPVLIDECCYIRAPFHPAMPAAKYEIVIEPKMSFGTAHHATTSQMIEYLLEADVTDKSLLDMGSGTGILAILAHLRGAHPIVAIDNDEWAYRNGLENTKLNHCADIRVLLGDASLLGNTSFDLITANINRNILMQDIPTYTKCLHSKGLLFLSGFYEDNDLDIIRQVCTKYGLQYVSHKVKDRWVAAKFCKL